MVWIILIVIFVIGLAGGSAGIGGIFLVGMGVLFWLNNMLVVYFGIILFAIINIIPIYFYDPEGLFGKKPKKEGHWSIMLTGMTITVPMVYFYFGFQTSFFSEIIRGLNEKNPIDYFFAFGALLLAILPIVGIRGFYINRTFFKKTNANSLKRSKNSKKINEWVHKIYYNQKIMESLAEFSVSQNIQVWNVKSKGRVVGRFWGATIREHYPNMPSEIMEEVADKLVAVVFEKKNINRVAPISKAKATKRKNQTKVIDREDLKNGTIVKIKKVGSFYKAFDSKDNNLSNLISSKTRKKAYNEGKNLKAEIKSDRYTRWVMVEKESSSLVERDNQKAKVKDSATPKTDTIGIEDHIVKLSELKDKGILTEEEFQAKKKELLDRI